MEYRSSNERRSSNTNESAYPSIALPVVVGASSSSYATPSSLYYGGVGNTNGGGTISSSSNNNNINGRLSTSSSIKDVLGLRKRDAIAILTCLFLLRIAFTPNNNVGESGSSITNPRRLA